MPSQRWTFRDRARAERLAGNIQGARLIGPRRKLGCGGWLLVAVLLVAGALALFGGTGVAR